MELKARVLLPGLLVMGVIVACGVGTATQASGGAAAIDPGPAMRQAVDQLLALESVAFSLDHIQGTTVLVPGVLMTKVYGEVSIPDRFRVIVEAESEFPKSFIKIGVITIEDLVYMTDIFSGRWKQVSADALPFNLSQIGQTLANIVNAVEEPKVVGEERVGGVDTLHIKGDIASEDLSDLIPGAGDGFPVGLELWVDRSEGLLRQVHIVGRVVPTDEKDTIRQLTLDEINQPVIIDPPDDVAG